MSVRDSLKTYHGSDEGRVFPGDEEYCSTVLLFYFFLHGFDIGVVEEITTGGRVEANLIMPRDQCLCAPLQPVIRQTQD